MTSVTSDRARALLLVGGHESADGRALAPLLERPELMRLRPRAVAAGRELQRALRAALAEAGTGGPVVVLSMTLGRDPRLVSDTARTVRWATRDEEPGRVALAPPFGTPDHLVGWLRAACSRVHDDDAAVLIAAASADPFDDAELHRVVALVRAHGGGRLVEVGLRGPGGELDAGVERCRRLGAERVAVVPAELGAGGGVAAPLLSPAAVARVVAARVATACHRLAEHGDDGVAAALGADHAHGFSHAHSHAEAHEQAHTHTHDRAAVG
ncbi:MAG TPA: hypothetical protein VFF79_19385 [Conexibacter sp.]|jgi:sirohydrochlorin cobaltochelatase|nr:hypothetical protein [Conexibacter sp.]